MYITHCIYYNCSFKHNSLFNKIFLPYINLSPSSENIISDEKIIILEETKDNEYTIIDKG